MIVRLQFLQLIHFHPAKYFLFVIIDSFCDSLIFLFNYFVWFTCSQIKKQKSGLGVMAMDYSCKFLEVIQEQLGTLFNVLLL